MGGANIQNNTSCLEIRTQTAATTALEEDGKKQQWRKTASSAKPWAFFCAQKETAWPPSLKQLLSWQWRIRDKRREKQFSYFLHWYDFTGILGFHHRDIKSLEAKLPQIPLFTPSPQQMPVQEVIIAINSAINSILSCPLLYLQDITPGQQLPVMKQATSTSGIAFILIVILYFIIFLTNPCPYQVHLHYWTPFLNDLMSPCIYPEKFIMSQ